MRKSTVFEFQVLRSVDVLVLLLPIVGTGPRQSLLVLYFFIRGKKGAGVGEAVLRDCYSIRLLCFGLVLITAQYLCVKYLICSCHRKLRKTSLETETLKTLLQDSTVK